MFQSWNMGNITNVYETTRSIADKTFVLNQMLIISKLALVYWDHGKWGYDELPVSIICKALNECQTAWISQFYQSKTIAIRSRPAENAVKENLKPKSEPRTSGMITFLICVNRGHVNGHHYPDYTYKPTHPSLCLTFRKSILNLYQIQQRASHTHFYSMGYQK